MKNTKKLSKFNKTELRIYEILGVKLFKKAILLFELIKHRNNGGYNKNYHPKDTSINTLKSFSGYLMYNVMFHVVSLFFVAVYFATTCITKHDFLLVDILMYIVIAFNLYCIMLQRYIYLKIKSHISKASYRRERYVQMCIDKITPILKKKKAQELTEEYDLIKKITYSTATGCDCILTNDSIDALNRLAEVVECLDTADFKKTRYVIKNKTFGQAISELANSRRLSGRIESRVSKLQKMLKVSNDRNIMFGYCIVTDCPECEKAYQKIFFNSTRDGIELILTVLLSAYQHEGLVVNI